MRCLQAPIVAQERVAEGIFELRFAAPRLSHSLPGQFIHLLCGDSFLRRPFSIHRAEGEEITILYRLQGAGTNWLSRQREGGLLNVLGPLGSSFASPRENERILLVGGGMGIAPLAFYAERHSHFPTEMIAMAGFRSASQVAGLQPFHRARVPLSLYSDDGSSGERNRVTAGLSERISEFGANRILACGPEEMMKSISAIAEKMNLPCQVSLERKMACGTGLCLGCIVPVGNSENYRRVCVDGPVFDAREIRWS